MNNTFDINIWQLLLSFVVLLVPLLIFRYYRIGIGIGMIIAAIRMVVQLALVAVYLEWVFEQNNALINSLWVLVMVVVGVFTTISRVSLNWRLFALPFFISTVISVVLVDAFFLGVVIKLDYVFDARYFIPITGMILGNSLKHNIVGLTTYYKGLRDKSELYQFLLTNTANTKLALRPFMADAIKQALNPLIATMSVIGLISLPGMMTGQILGGSSPVTAIKYQVMIMLAVFVGCTITLTLSLIISNRIIFDPFYNLKKDVFLKRKRRA